MPPKKVGACVCSPGLPERASRQRHLPAQLGQGAAERARDLRRAAARKEEQPRDDAATAQPPRRALSTPVQAPAPNTGPTTLITTCPHYPYYRTLRRRLRSRAETARRSSPHAHPPRCPLRRPILVRRLPHILRRGRQRYGLIRSRTVSFFTSTSSTASKARARLCRSSPRRTTISSGWSA